MPVCGSNAATSSVAGQGRCYAGAAGLDQGGGHMTLIAFRVCVQCARQNDRRLRCNLVVSPGQEISGTMADYMDFALEQPMTRVVGLFLETVRDPAGFLAALEKAEMRDIPIVALKVGRTEMSARMAASHSGAIVGDHAAFQAVFDRYGVIESTTGQADQYDAISQDRRVKRAASPRLHSGGERELLIGGRRLWRAAGRVNETTRDRLAATLEWARTGQSGRCSSTATLLWHLPECLTAIAGSDTAIARSVPKPAPASFTRTMAASRHARDHSDVPIIVLNNRRHRRRRPECG
jgi:hypothetical protein